MEMENTIPIMCNILKIKDGDILVSDMYLTENDIMRLIRFHGINKNITLYVSPSGKSSGEMWNKLTKIYNIMTHPGDNYHSDIAMAKNYNIPGIFTKIHLFTELEKSLSNYFELRKFLRTFRMANPYLEDSIENKLYDQQIQYNIPLLLFMCKKLETILIKENRNTVLFLSRDGCLIIKLFSALYPQYKSIYFHSSRIVNRNYNEDYISYVKENYNKETCLLFDLHGSFDSGQKIFTEIFGHLPRIFFFDLTYLCQYKENITYITNCSCVIERFNQDVVGTLCNYLVDKDIRVPLENNLNYIKVSHNTVDRFVTYASNEKISSVFVNNDIFQDDNFWKNYYKYIVCESEVLFKTQFEPITLTEIANKFNSDKGNTSGCSHHYSIKYEEIINDMRDSFNEDFSLLEIGFNRINSDEIPSIMMWKEYFNDNGHFTGFDINSDLLKFNNIYKNVEIKIGDQSNENDLQKLKTKKYNIIIDDGYHASKHQQISFKTLWESVIEGGYYVIEDLHYQPQAETCIKTKTLFENWMNKNYIETEFISKYELEKIVSNIEEIKFSDSKSKNWGDTVKNAFVYIKKNNV